MLSEPLVQKPVFLELHRLQGPIEPTETIQTNIFHCENGKTEAQGCHACAQSCNECKNQDRRYVHVMPIAMFLKNLKDHRTEWKFTELFMHLFI